jgi:hypothetical protein
MAIETILDQPDYNIFTDPELATRSPEFLQEYISNLKPDDYSSLLELDYGKHGNILTNEDYRKAMLADEELYRD